MNDIVEMGRRWQRAWTSHLPDANNSVGISFGELTDEVERLRTVNAALLEALEDIAYQRVPRTSRSGMFMVTAADHARTAIALAKGEKP